MKCRRKNQKSANLSTTYMQILPFQNYLLHCFLDLKLLLFMGRYLFLSFISAQILKIYLINNLLPKNMHNINTICGSYIQNEIVQGFNCLQNRNNQMPCLFSEGILQEIKENKGDIDEAYFNTQVLDFSIVNTESEELLIEKSNNIPKDQSLIWTQYEHKLLFSLQSKIGNKWSTLVQMIPGKTVNSVKNHFYTKLRRGYKIINLLLRQSKIKGKCKIIKVNFLQKLFEVIGDYGQNKLNITSQLMMLTNQIKNALIECSGEMKKMEEEQIIDIASKISLFNQLYRKKRTHKHKGRIPSRKYQRKPQKGQSKPHRKKQNIIHLQVMHPQQFNNLEHRTNQMVKISETLIDNKWCNIQQDIIIKNNESKCRKTICPQNIEKCLQVSQKGSFADSLDKQQDQSIYKSEMGKDLLGGEETFEEYFLGFSDVNRNWLDFLVFN